MDPTSLLQQSLVNAVPHCKMLHWYSLSSGREFQILTKIWLHFWQHIIDVWHLPSVYVACKGLSDLGNGPNKPTATIIGECSASLQDAALVFTLVGGWEFQILTKICWLHFWQHIIDVWHLPSVYVACKCWLGNGLNKPTATIIGECSASLQDAALVFTLVRVRISDTDKNLATFLIINHWCLASSQCVCSL